MMVWVEQRFSAALTARCCARQRLRYHRGSPILNYIGMHA
jgi:hypothetical protein